MRNDSECSFNLTDDEDRENNADYHNKKGRGSGPLAKRQTQKSSTARDHVQQRPERVTGSSHNLSQLSPSIQDRLITEGELVVGKLPF